MADQDRNTQVDEEYHIRWEELHMGIALLAAERCKIPNSKSGACIVNRNVFPDKPEGTMSSNAGKVVGVGYQGRPVGSTTIHPFFQCHAEMNAISFKASADVIGCTMFVTKFPCVDCANHIIQSGIKEVIYLGKIEPHQNPAKIVLDDTGVKCRPYQRSKSSITLKFE